MSEPEENNFFRKCLLNEDEVVHLKLVRDELIYITVWDRTMSEEKSDSLKYDFGELLRSIDPYRLMILLESLTPYRRRLALQTWPTEFSVVGN